MASFFAFNYSFEYQNFQKLTLDNNLNADYITLISRFLK